MNQRKKDTKVKQRAERVLRKRLKQRAVIIAEGQKDREHYHREMALRPRKKPFRKDEVAEMEQLTDQKIQERLKRNVEIIKALEEEYERELSQRQANSEKLKNLQNPETKVSEN